MNSFSFLVVLQTILSLFGSCSAEIYHYTDYKIESPVLVYREVAQFSPRDAPSTSDPGSGRSFIDYRQLRLKRQDGGRTCELQGLEEISPCYDPDIETMSQLLIFPSDLFSSIGYQSSLTGEHVYCCNADAIDEGACSSPHEVILSNVTKADKRLFVLDIPLDATSTIMLRELNHMRYHVKESDIYVLMIANCDPMTGDVIINGLTRWMNPYGYLPGDEYGYLPFFEAVAIFYLVLVLIWVCLCVVYRHDLLPVQLWITMVIVLGFSECAVQFYDYYQWNLTGDRSSGLMIAGVLSGVCKRSLSRVLVLMVSLGYGVVKPTLGPITKNILMLGLAYFLVSSSYALMTSLQSSEKTLGESAYFDFLSILILMSAALDVVFYLWILQALTEVIDYLAERKQSVKLLLYRRFRSVLLISLLFSVCWAIYSTYMSYGDRLDEQWDERWTIDAIWEVCYLLILYSIAFLWAPSTNNTRYAYSIELSPMDNDEDLVGGPEVADNDDDDDLN